MHVARHFVAALFAFAVGVGSADAALITLNYDFSAGGYAAGAPVDPVTGTFSVTFNNAATLENVTAGLSVTNLNISLGSAAAFSYSPIGDTLYIGGLATGAIGLSTPGNDFILGIQGASTTPTVLFLAYTQGAPQTFNSQSGTLTPTTPAAVPEPASLTLLGFGLAGMGVRRWRQRRA